MSLREIFGEPIHVYTRKQAIADGELVDVSDTAKEAGITLPVAVTRHVWAEYVTPDPRAVEASGQSERGRLWDVVSMLRFAIMAGRGRNMVMFKVAFIMKARQRKTVVLKAMLGPGDDGAPVITIMLPEED